MVRGGILAQGETPSKDVRGHLFNAVFKVERYAPDYPGLRDRDLSPKGVIERPVSDKGKTGLDKADAPPAEGRGAAAVTNDDLETGDANAVPRDSRIVPTFLGMLRSPA